jgi:hypothetical protein
VVRKELAQVAQNIEAENVRHEKRMAELEREAKAAAGRFDLDAVRRVEAARDEERATYKARLAHLLHRGHRLRAELNELAAG